MALYVKLYHGTEGSKLAYRKRLWICSQLAHSGFPIPEERMSSLKSIDALLFDSSNSPAFLNASNQCMDLYRYSRLDNTGGLRESAEDDVMSWVGKDDRRFYNWFFVYWSMVLGHSTPFYNSNSIRPFDKMVLWFDSISGYRKDKKDLEVYIKKIWFQKKYIDKALPHSNREGEGYWQFVWDGTFEEFKSSREFEIAQIMIPGFDSPIGDDECYFSSLLLFDLSDMGQGATKALIDKIKRRWRNKNRKRTKTQVNISLSSSAADKLESIVELRGEGKSALVEQWIWDEAKKLNSE